MTCSPVTMIRGARVLDPYRGIDDIHDVYIADGRFIDSTDATRSPVTIVEAQGLWLAPRLIDMHVHFREPGQTWKETLLTGSRAAAHGGFSAVATMPNTTPVTDTPELIEWLHQRGDRMGLVRLLPLGAVTRSRTRPLTWHTSSKLSAASISGSAIGHGSSHTRRPLSSS